MCIFIKKKTIATLAICLVIALIIGIFALTSKDPYQKKAKLLKQTIQTSLENQNFEPSNGLYVVMLSPSNMEYRTNVYTGTGADFNTAWNNANRQAANASKNSNHPIRYLKCDVVYNQITVTPDQFTENLKESRNKYCFYGISFDRNFQTALLEAECNATDIYDYENGELNIDTVNEYLTAAGRQALDALPERYVLFETYSWLCDSNNQIMRLNDDWDYYGRRITNKLDAEYTAAIIHTSAEYLLSSMDETGKFRYSHFPVANQDSPDYSIVRHVGVIWSLVNYYRMSGDETVQPALKRAIDYMLTQVEYKDPQTSYLHGESKIILGGNGLAVVALASYMDAFNDMEYLDACKHLGNGILTFIDPETNSFWHSMDDDLNLVKEYLTVFYDGEATLGLCMIYNLTRDEKYLDAAKTVSDYFVANHYELYTDHWISYAMNELTKICPDEEDYYKLSVKNLQTSIPEYKDRILTSPTGLELLMAGFETLQRYKENFNPDLSWFDEDELLYTIRLRAEKQLNGYFWPEYAMYMPYPSKILGSFFTRSDSFRIRMDDIQHNIGGYYLYMQNYDNLIAAGMPETIS